MKDVLYVLDAFPRRTETFIYREMVCALEAGVRIRVLALQSTGEVLDPEFSRLQDVIHIPSAPSLAEYFFRTLAFASRHPMRAVSRVLGSMGTGRSISDHLSIARWCLVAWGYVHKSNLGSSIGHVHAQFATHTADVAYCLAQSLGVRHSVFAHAWDIYCQDRLVLRERLAHADRVFCCHRDGCERLNAVSDASQEVVYAPHGIDVDLWQSEEEPDYARCHVISVGRCVAKKAFGHLIAAWANVVASLPGECSPQLTLVSEGPERASIDAAIQTHGVSGSVVCQDFMSQGELRALMLSASTLVLPSITGDDGDRDGVPNVVIEAGAMGLALVASRIPGVMECFPDDAMCIQVPPGDVDALAAGMLSVLHDEPRRRRMGLAAKDHICRTRTLSTAIQPLVDYFKTRKGLASR